MIKERLLIFRKVEKARAKEPARPSTMPAAEKAEVRRDSQVQRADLADTSASELTETTPELSIEERTRSVLETLINGYTNDEKVRALFDQTKMNLDIALDALMKIKPKIVKRLQEGYRFESYSEDGLIWHWSKAGQIVSEINPIFKQEGILKMMDQNARKKLEGLKNAIIMERVRRYIDQHIFSYMKKIRPNISKDLFYNSYLIREEVIPILAAGYEEGARPYEFIATGQGFQLKSDIAVFNTHDFVLSDYDWNLNLRVTKVKQQKSIVNMNDTETINELLIESLKTITIDDLMSEEDRQQAQEEALIKQAMKDNFAAENAAADNLYNKFGDPDDINPDDLPALRDEIYEQMADLAGRNELVGEDNTNIQEYLDYLYTQTDGGTTVPGDRERATAILEGWPGFQQLNDETRGAWELARQRGDYESMAALRTYNRFTQYFIQSLGLTF